MNAKKSVFLLIICITAQDLLTMEKKEAEDKDVYLYQIVKDKAFQQFRNLTTKVQFIYESNLDKSERLTEVWQNVYENTRLKRIIHKDDNVMYVQIDVTQATKMLKDFFYLQIKSDIESKIRDGTAQITGLYLHPHPPQPQPNCSLLYKTFYGLALISAGWIGKSLWDAGGKKLTILWGNYLLHQLVNHLENSSLNSIFLQKI